MRLKTASPCRCSGSSEARLRHTDWRRVLDHAARDHNEIRGNDHADSPVTRACRFRLRPAV
ncbi:hypothetical protein BOS5A_110501 [Bosea sp. EC-HK365B]|nr:hypothetical protein BOS5A_110501 [Bosea sp. EC-HK365B]